MTRPEGWPLYDDPAEFASALEEAAAYLDSMAEGEGGTLIAADVENCASLCEGLARQLRTLEES